jgi:hypothetical protein
MWQPLANATIYASQHIAAGTTLHLSPYALALRPDDGGITSDAANCQGTVIDPGYHCTCTVPSAGYYAVTWNAYQNGNMGPYSNDLYRIGKNSGELTAFLGTLKPANGTYNSVSPSTRIDHVAEDNIGTLYGFGIYPNPLGDGGLGNNGYYFVRIDPATETMTPVTTTPIQNQPSSMAGFSPGTSGGLRFAILDQSGNLWCADAQANNTMEMILPTSLVNAHNTAVTGDCALDGRYDVTLLTDGLGALQFVEAKQTAVIQPPPATNANATATPLSPGFTGGLGLSSDGTTTFGQNLQQRTGPSTAVQSLGPRYWCGQTSSPPIVDITYEGG